MPQQPEESRLLPRERRRELLLRGTGSIEGGDSFKLTFLDLSFDGCRIETAVVLEPGHKLNLFVHPLGALRAEVRWYTDGFAGLHFDPAAQEQPRVERHDDRSNVSTTVSLRRAGRHHYNARVFDLSRYGCKVEFIERPKQGERLWAKFNGLDSIEAEVRWVDGFYGGIEFVRPIYPVVFDILLARLQST